MCIHLARLGWPHHRCRLNICEFLVGELHIRVIIDSLHIFHGLCFGVGEKLGDLCNCMGVSYLLVRDGIQDRFAVEDLLVETLLLLDLSFLESERLSIFLDLSYALLKLSLNLIGVLVEDRISVECFDLSFEGAHKSLGGDDAGLKLQPEEGDLIIFE